MNKRTLTLLSLVICPVLAMGQIDGYRATYYVDGNKENYQYRSSIQLESTNSNASTVYATNGVELILIDMAINKTMGASADEDRRLTGVNSAILADGGSNIHMEECDVKSNCECADGFSAVGEGTKANIYKGSIRMTRADGAAVNASQDASIRIEKTIIDTYSSHSPAFYAISNGSVDILGCTGKNSGQVSPLFYSSNGNIKAQNCIMGTDRWSIGCVDEGLLDLTKNELKTKNLCGFLVYGAKECQRESRTWGKLILNNNRLEVSEGPLVFVTNSGGDIYLSRNKISCSNDEIISIKADDWGIQGQNYGEAKVTLEKQSLKGDILVDDQSSLDLNLKKGSKFNGNITGPNSSKRTVKVYMGKGTKWSFKGDCYLTSISFEQPFEKGLKQIKGKHTIYYDSSDPANAALNGKEYKTSKGVLKPM